MSNSNIPQVGDHTAKLLANIAADGQQSDTFTEAEKLALVADDMMDPKEVGLTSADEAKLQLMPDAEKIPVLGTDAKLELGTVPIQLRAHWAYEDSKIIMAKPDEEAFKQKWMDENKNTFRIQGVLTCGNTCGTFERTFKDPILGLCEMMRTAAQMLEDRYTGNIKLRDNDGPITAVVDTTPNETAKPTE